MKVVSFILSLLILSMALLPCADEPGMNEAVCTESQTDHGDNEDTDPHEQCSPFCTCHCCHSHVTQHCIFCLKTFVSFSSNPSDQPFPLLSRISFSIWDPPPFGKSNPIA